jgi:hypothetical protein
MAAFVTGDIFLPWKRWIRVITLEDGETVHNAFPDRDFQEPGP